MSSKKFESLQETLMLLSQPNFKKEFEASVEQANNGEVVSFKEVLGEEQQS